MRNQNLQFSAKGQFWYHLNPNDKVFGVLETFPDGTIQLSTFDSFKEIKDLLTDLNFHEPIDWIEGELENYDLVWLAKSTLVDFINYGMVRLCAVLNSELLITGPQPSGNEDLLFKEVKFRFQYIDDWARNYDLKSDYSEVTAKSSISPSHIPDVFLFENQSIKIYLKFETSFPVSTSNKITPGQWASFRVDFKKSLDLETLFYWKEKLHRFYILTSGYVSGIHGSEGIRGDQHYILNFARNKIREGYGDNGPMRHSYLLRLSNDEDLMRVLLKFWIENYSTLLVSANFYFKAIYSQNPDPEYYVNDFLNYFQALEIAYQSINPETKGPKIASGTPEFIRLKSKIGFESEKSIDNKKALLLEICWKVRDVSALFKTDFELLSWAIVETRNFLNHGPNSTKSDPRFILSGKDLKKATQFLRIICQAYYLDFLGLEGQELAKAIRRPSPNQVHLGFEILKFNKNTIT